MRSIRGLAGLSAGVLVGVLLVGVELPVHAQGSAEFLFVSVLDGETPVRGLAPDEIIVEEDGERREVLRLAQGEIPMQVAFLVDDSLGLTRSLSHIRTGLRELVDALPDDQFMTFITFGDEMRTVVDLTQNKDRIRNAADEFVLFSETSGFMLNALVETARNLQRRGATRPVIILIATEGSNSALTRVGPGPRISGPVSPQSGQGLGAEQVLRALRDARVAVHAMIVRGVGNPTFSRSPTDAVRFGLLQSGFGETDRAAVLEQLPRVTGGVRKELVTTSSFSELLLRVANDLIHQYLVMYARPASLVPPTEIDVKVDRSDLTVRFSPAPPLDP